MSLNKIKPNDMTPEDGRFLERTPKAVLYAMLKHMAAARDGNSYDKSLTSGSYLKLMHEEWANLHDAGIIPQKPPKTLDKLTQR
jgi:hypothetical protein